MSQGGFLPIVLWKTYITDYTITKISCVDKTAFLEKQEIVNWGPFLVCEAMSPDCNSGWDEVSPNLTVIRHPYSEPPVSRLHFSLWNPTKYFCNHLTKNGQNPCGQQRQLDGVCKYMMVLLTQNVASQCCLMVSKVLLPICTQLDFFQSWIKPCL